MNARWVWALIGATTTTDQLTKAAALSLLLQGNSVAVLPGLDLTLGFNVGVSFGLFSDLMAGKPLVMAALRLLLFLRWRSPSFLSLSKVFKTSLHKSELARSFALTMRDHAC